MDDNNNVKLLQKLIEKDDTKFKTEFEEKLRIFKEKYEAWETYLKSALKL